MTTATADPVAEAKAIVERYLELSMIPDPEAASAFVAPSFELVFTGGRRFAGPAESAAFNARRYASVKKRFLRTDAALDPETGDVHVYNTGYLYGAWPDGTPFETNRYLDRFVVRDGLIVRTDVWNDSAEILLARPASRRRRCEPLPTHDRYDYVPITRRPDYAWPNGTRLAVYLGLNLEHFAFGEGLGAELAPGGPQPDVLNYAWRDYGNRVGAWRCSSCFDAARPAGHRAAQFRDVRYAPSSWRRIARAATRSSATAAPIPSARASSTSRRARADRRDDARSIAAAEGARPQAGSRPGSRRAASRPTCCRGGLPLHAELVHGRPAGLDAHAAGPLLAMPYPQELNDIPAIVAGRTAPTPSPT
jgi:hypothetical protein